MPWTQFWDMHSGGGLKEPPFSQILIEAPHDEALIIFYNRFGHNPHRVSCTCCGEDYSTRESETLEQVTAYHRNCWYRRNSKEANDGEYVEQQDPECTYSTYSTYVPLDLYLEKSHVLVIRADEIKPEERVGEVPEDGYVWVG